MDRLTQSVEAAQEALKDLSKELNKGTRDVLKDLDTTLRDAQEELAQREQDRHQGPQEHPTGAAHRQTGPEASRTPWQTRRRDANPTEGDHRRQSENGAEADDGCGNNAGTHRDDRCIEGAHAVGSREHRAADGLHPRGVGTAGPPRTNALGSVASRSASAAPSPRYVLLPYLEEAGADAATTLISLAVEFAQAIKEPKYTGRSRTRSTKRESRRWPSTTSASASRSATLDAIKAIADATDPATLRTPVEPRRLDAIKFASCVPDAALQRMISERDADEPAVARVLREPIRLASR